MHSVMVTYAINGTTKTMKIVGPYTTVQLFPGGSAIITVHTENMGPVLRSVHVADAFIIDRHAEAPDPGLA